MEESETPGTSTDAAQSSTDGPAFAAAAAAENMCSKIIKDEKSDTVILDEENAEGDGESKCGICWQRITDPSVPGGCGVNGKHVYCFSCLRQWFKQSPNCPLCCVPSTFIRHKMDTNNGDGVIESYAELKKQFDEEAIIERSKAVPLATEQSALRHYIRTLRTHLNRIHEEHDRQHHHSHSGSERPLDADNKRKRERLLQTMNAATALKDACSDGSISRGDLVSDATFRGLVYEDGLIRNDVSHNDHRRSFTTQITNEEFVQVEPRLREYLRRELNVCLDGNMARGFLERILDDLLGGMRKYQINSPSFEILAARCSLPRWCVTKFCSELFDFASSNLSIKLFFENSQYRHPKDIENNSGNHAAAVINLDDSVAGGGEEDDVMIVGVRNDNRAQPSTSQPLRDYLRDSGSDDDDSDIYVHPACLLPRSNMDPLRVPAQMTLGFGRSGGFPTMSANDVFGVPLFNRTLLPFPSYPYREYRGRLPQDPFDDQRRRVPSNPNGLRDVSVSGSDEDTSPPNGQNNGGDVVVLSSDEEGQFRSQQAAVRKLRTRSYRSTRHNPMVDPSPDVPGGSGSSGQSQDFFDNIDWIPESTPPRLRSRNAQFNRTSRRLSSPSSEEDGTNPQRRMREKWRPINGRGDTKGKRTRRDCSYSRSDSDYDDIPVTGNSIVKSTRECTKKDGTQKKKNDKKDVEKTLEQFEDYQSKQSARVEKTGEEQEDVIPKDSSTTTHVPHSGQSKSLFGVPSNSASFPSSSTSLVPTTLSFPGSGAVVGAVSPGPSESVSVRPQRCDLYETNIRQFKQMFEENAKGGEDKEVAKRVLGDLRHAICLMKGIEKEWQTSVETYHPEERAEYSKEPDNERNGDVTQEGHSSDGRSDGDNKHSKKHKHKKDRHRERSIEGEEKKKRKEKERMEREEKKENEKKERRRKEEERKEMKRMEEERKEKERDRRAKAANVVSQLDLIVPRRTRVSTDGSDRSLRKRPVTSYREESTEDDDKHGKRRKRRSSEKRDHGSHTKESVNKSAKSERADKERRETEGSSQSQTDPSQQMEESGRRRAYDMFDSHSEDDDRSVMKRVSFW